MTLIRKFKDLRHRVFYGALMSHGFKLITLCAPGSICPWTICPDGLDEKSVVHSGGVGSDISFEHELVKRYGCKIVLYDPSPTGVKTMALPENKIPQFRYLPFALTAGRETLKMAPPPQPGGDAWFPREDAVGTLEVACVDLQTAMRQNGHDHIDLLKLDIEGSEYEVIDDVLRNRIPVRQICVEFHHAILPGYRRSQTVRAIRKLILSGYKLICREGENLTFIKN
jgi:FkbM family methyltransferase